MKTLTHHRAAIIAATTCLALASVSTIVVGADDTDADGVPDTAEPLLGTDPGNPDTDGDGRNDLEDEHPVALVNPMPSGGEPARFEIGEALVENNYDPAAKRDATDHLELLVANPGDTPLGDFSIYYSMEDLESGAIESYYRKLDGFEVPAGGEARVHFDEGSTKGHFRANPESLYTRSESAKTFSVSLQEGERMPVTVEIAKDAGGAEEAD